MKERGIIFTAWSIPKIMDRTKTMTRRTYGLEEINKHPDVWFNPINIAANIWQFENIYDSGFLFYVKCPYGQVGDRLWVRETWAEQGGDIYYKADWSDTKPVNMVYNNIKWRSPRFMPRWASRIDLEITEVRAERLKAISVLDLIKEGIEPQYEFDTNAYNEPPMFEEFIALWDSLNPRCPWSANNWVWPISFKEVK